MGLRVNSWGNQGGDGCASVRDRRYGRHRAATTTSAAKLGLPAQLGADGVVMDGLDALSVGEAVAAARPDAIVNQMTGPSEAHAGKPNLRKADRFFATTIRLRSEGPTICSRPLRRPTFPTSSRRAPPSSMESARADG